jgi:hypothetical protein
MNKYRKMFEKFWIVYQMENKFKGKDDKDFIYQLFLEGAMYNQLENTK